MSKHMFCKLAVRKTPDLLISFTEFEIGQQCGGILLVGKEGPVEVISLSMEEKLVSSSEFAATNNTTHPARQDQSGSNKRKISKGKGTASGLVTVEDLQPLFGSKRVDAAKCLGVSVSTLKRIRGRLGIPRWPNRIRTTVVRSLDGHGENNPSPTCKIQTTNGQIEMEDEKVYHFREPNEVLLDSSEISTEKLSECTLTPEDWQSFIASLEEPIREENFSGPRNLTVLPCSESSS